MLDIIYGGVLHVVTLGAILFSLIKMVQTIRDDDSSFRTLALVGGVLIYMGARTSGTDIPHLIINALNVGSFDSTFTQILASGMIGAITATILVWMVKKSGEFKKLMYLFIMTTTFILLTLSDMYTLANFTSTDSSNELLNINLYFITGLILAILFQVNEDDLDGFRY